MKDEKAVAIMMGNLKGSKIKPSGLLELAEACRILKKKWGIKEMSHYFRVSQYMLRQIDKINDLNPKLKKLVEAGKLGIDASYQLWRLNEPKRSQVGEIVKDMNTDEIRVFVRLLHANPKLSVSDCKKLFDKMKSEKLRLLVLPLDTEIYERMKKSADKSKLTLHNYALKILRQGLDGKKKK